MKLRRPRPLDAVLIGVVVLLTLGVAFAQLSLGGDDKAQPGRPSATPSYLQTSVGNPYPEVSPSVAPPQPSGSGAPGAPGSAPGGSSAPGSAAQSLAQQAQSLAAHQPAVFRVATLNVLGSSHTSARGDESGRPAGAWRIGRSLQVLAAHQVSVVGLQEFETIQARTFLAQSRGAWRIYPGLDGDTRDAIAWRPDVFDLVQAQTVRLPYFNGSMVDMPVVLLRERRSGKEFYYFNVHNAADTYKYHHQQANRTSAMAREVQLIKQMHAFNIPVIFTGDMNEREPAFCLFTSQAPLHSAYGGTNDPATGCQPPSIGGVPIDWIFGTPEVTFSDPVVDHSDLVRAATDHPFYAATVTLQ